MCMWKGCVWVLREIRDGESDGDGVERKPEYWCVCVCGEWNVSV